MFFVCLFFYLSALPKNIISLCVMCDLHVDYIIQIALALTDRKRVKKIMSLKPKKQKYDLGSQY